jgi:hypothetical protein
VDDEIDRAFAKERDLMKERERKVLAVIPLNLDGYLLSGECGVGKCEAVLAARGYLVVGRKDPHKPKPGLCGAPADFTGGSRMRRSLKRRWRT